MRRFLVFSAASGTPGSHLPRLSAWLAAGMALLLLTACGTVSDGVRSLTPNFSWTYKIDIQQGAVLTREMVAQLRPGMTREQVRFVLGTPPLADVFHASRWDYPYTMQRRGGSVEMRHFTVYFEDNRLKSFEGDEMPTEAEIKGIKAASAEATPPASGASSPPAETSATNPGATPAAPGTAPSTTPAPALPGN